MFRKLLATTAITTLLIGGAVAQEAKPADPAAPAAPATTTDPATTTTAPAASAAKAVTKENGQLASNIIGENVYNSTAENAENIGEVNDIVIDGSGAVKSLIVGVGGFLGVGERNVEVDYKSATWAANATDEWIVVAMPKEQIEALPPFDMTPYEPAAPAATGSTAAPADAPAAAPAAPADAPAAAPAEAPKPAN